MLGKSFKVKCIEDRNVKSDRFKNQTFHNFTIIIITQYFIHISFYTNHLKYTLHLIFNFFTYIT